jgi:hypothetical protein
MPESRTRLSYKKWSAHVVKVLQKGGNEEAHRQVKQERESGLTTLVFTAPEAMEEMENECKWKMFEMVRCLHVTERAKASLAGFFSTHT